jgi:hypothetical protein
VNRQLSLGWLDLLQLILALVAHSVLEPGCLVVIVVTGGGWAVASYRLEALVEEVRVFVVLGGLFGDFWEGARLRDGDQLPVWNQRCVLGKVGQGVQIEPQTSPLRFTTYSVDIKHGEYRRFVALNSEGVGSSMGKNTWKLKKA